MGTRGLYGFHKNGIDKLTYNHLGSYTRFAWEEDCRVLQMCRQGRNELPV